MGGTWEGVVGVACRGISDTRGEVPMKEECYKRMK